MPNPFGRNPLETRADIQKLALDLWKPLKPHFSEGGARLRLGGDGAMELRSQEMEGFARSLWPLIPLGAGGGAFGHWPLYVKGLSNGTNPNHPEYWGENFCQPEYGTFGVALCLIPNVIWQPLSTEAKKNFARALLRVNTVELYDNNWLFWRALANLGLSRAGEPHDAKASEAALDRIDEFYLGDGWYYDGVNGQPDYYVPWAFHFYALIYAALAEKSDPFRAKRYKERAAKFAGEFIHWFAADGAALPYGRSLFYRFAQGAFWGALAFADVEAFPWGVLKGLYLRHLKWWSARPVFTSSGALSSGYGYDQPNLEGLSSPGMPYWAGKALLPLAVPESHPFWRAEAAPLPAVKKVIVQKHPGMSLFRNPSDGHVTALVSSVHACSTTKRHWPERYCKFAYSTAFGFSVPAMPFGLSNLAPDSMLALSEEGEYYRVRRAPYESKIDGQALYSKWLPFPGVTVETWLIPAPPWHVRVHHLVTGKKLLSAEGGFCIPQDEKGYHSFIIGLLGDRLEETIATEFGTNVLFPRARLPLLKGEHPAGEHWLACAVLGVKSDRARDSFLSTTPRLVKEKGAVVIEDGTTGDKLFSVSMGSLSTWQSQKSQESSASRRYH